MVQGEGCAASPWSESAVGAASEGSPESPRDKVRSSSAVEPVIGTVEPPSIEVRCVDSAKRHSGTVMRPGAGSPPGTVVVPICVWHPLQSPLGAGEDISLMSPVGPTTRTVRSG